MGIKIEENDDVEKTNQTVVQVGQDADRFAGYRRWHPQIILRGKNAESTR